MMDGLLKLVNVASSCLFFFFLATNGASIPTEFLKKNLNDSIAYHESLDFVGMADGKEFFVDNDAEMSWEVAKRYCEIMNMQLASITSEAQATMLENSYNSSTFNGFYWTSARDALDLRQFIWDKEDKQPDSAYLRFNKNRSQLTCLYYFSAGAESYLSNFECTYVFGRPLCDTGNQISKK